VKAGEGVQNQGASLPTSVYTPKDEREWRGLKQGLNKKGKEEETRGTVTVEGLKERVLALTVLRRSSVKGSQ